MTWNYTLTRLDCSAQQRSCRPDTAGDADDLYGAALSVITRFTRPSEFEEI